MQVEVAMGVVAQFEARLQPVAQHRYARGLHLAIDLQLAFVDEPHHRHAGLLQLRHQLRVPCRQFGFRRLAHALPRQVVDGDGDAAIRFGGMRAQRKRRQQQYTQEEGHARSREADGAASLPSATALPPDGSGRAAGLHPQSRIDGGTQAGMVRHADAEFIPQYRDDGIGIRQAAPFARMAEAMEREATVVEASRASPARCVQHAAGPGTASPDAY